MTEATTRVLAPLLATALMFGALSGCNNGGDGNGDKAGGSDAPKVLRLAVADDADQPDAPFARYFARQVSARSDGSVHVRVVWDAAGQDSPGYELGIARLVHDGDFDLGWMGARAWDRMGIKSFQALQAPFLVTDHELLGRITTGPLAARMLGGLDGHGFVGLAVVPEHLRYALGAKKPLASPDAFIGARIQVKQSEATDALMRALGATPVHISGDDLPDAVAKGEIDGSEASLGTNAPDEGQVHLTANLPLFPKTLTLFAGDGAFDQLGEAQQEAIREAARMTAVYAAAHAPSETTLVRRFCREGPPSTAVAASAGDVAALERAAQPVYTQLERDRDTKATIAAIRTLKAASPAALAAAPPATCENELATVSGPERSPSAFNGTYRWRLTVQGARRIGVPSDDEDVGSIVTMTMRDGKMMLGDDEFYSGTFEIRGKRLVLKWPQASTTNILEFERHADGTLDVKAVPPINRGDEYVIASAPWRRVGPPIRDIP